MTGTTRTPIWYQACAPGGSPELRAARECLLDLLRSVGFGPRDVFAVQLATEEALMNAVMHGNKNDRTKLVRLAYQLEEDHVVVEVEDEGEGFCPEAVPDPTLRQNRERPCGRGIALMQAFLDSVTFHSPGNCVTMRKSRTITYPD